MKHRPAAVVSLALGSLAILTACGSPRPASIPANGGVAAAASTTAIGESARTAQPAIAAASGPPTQAAQPGSGPSSSQGAAGLPVPPVTRMVIKNGSLSIAVIDVENSLGQVDQIVRAEQGVIASQTIRTQDDKTFATLTLQVPPDNFEDTLARLRDVRAPGSRVIGDSVNSQDVTDQYVDLEAQHRNLQATRDAYQKLLDRATSVADIITLTREVNNIQTQMDQIEGRQRIISRQSAISTITLALSPLGATPAPGPRPLPLPAEAARQAWAALVTALQGLSVVLIWMAVLLPLPAAAIWLGWTLFSRVSQRAHHTAGSTTN